MVEYMLWKTKKLTCADNTFATDDLQLPVVKYDNKVCVIHRIQVEGPPSYGATADIVEAALTKNVKTAIPDLDESDLIWKFAKAVEITTSGLINDNRVMDSGPIYPPLLVANSKIHLCAKQKSGASHDLTLRIGYTIRKVTKEQMYDSLSDD